MVSEQTAVNTITINAAEQDHLIDSVTVFQAGRAEIKRRVQLELKQGQNRIDIEHLPNCTNEDSVRVQGSGTAVIFDVVYHSPYRKATPDPSTDGEDSDGDSDEEYAQQYCSLQTLRKERNIVKQQSDFLDLYSRNLNNRNFGPDDIERFLDMYATRQNALEQRAQEIGLQIGRAEKALRKSQAKKPQDNLDLLAERRTKITVTVLSKEHGKAELLLTYVVSKASWTPIYDMRASLGQSPGKSSTVEVHYRASITQTTGEDWPEVGLTLSTAAPYRGATMPTLPTWRIGLPASRPPRPPTRVHSGITSRTGLSPVCRLERSSSSSSSSSSSRSRSPPRAIIVEGSARSPTIIHAAYPADAVVEVPMDVRQADSVDAGVLSAKFSISGRSNIPSDVSTHKVLITSLNLQAEPEWVCIPRREESVFLRCKVVNASQFTFLPGETSIFMDDNFVSKSRIEYVPPNESLQVSLGIDSGIRVTYPPVRTYNHTTSQSGFNLPGRPKNPTQNIVKYSQTITVRNSRQTAVSGLRVLDHVPVSNHSSVKVNVISPKGLRSANGSKEAITEEKGLQQAWVEIRKGIYARWAPPDIGGEGTIQWMCTIGAGKEIELQLEWEVSAPVGTSWKTL